MGLQRNVLSAQQLALLDALPASTAIVDNDGVIWAVNIVWRSFGVANGRPDPDSDIGWSYHQWSGDRDPTAATAASGVLDVISGRLDEFSLAYPCHSPTEERWFQFLVVPLPAPAPRPVLTAHLRVGERVAAQLAGMTGEALRRLEGIITLCAWCRANHVDMAGEWTAIAEPPTELDSVSHGICPTCMSTLIPLGKTSSR